MRHEWYTYELYGRFLAFNRKSYWRGVDKRDRSWVLGNAAAAKHRIRKASAEQYGWRDKRLFEEMTESTEFKLNYNDVFEKIKKFVSGIALEALKFSIRQVFIRVVIDSVIGSVDL